MKIENIDKICFDGVNLLTSSGILKMCQDPNEFDSFYTHSVLNNLAGVMKHSRMFFMNASERVYLLVKILQKEGIDELCDQGSRSLPRWTELRPPYSAYYACFSNRFLMPATLNYEKRETFFGLFTLRNEQKGKDEHTTQYRLQATDLSYVSGQKVSNEFYCRIESHFIEESESNDRAPKSTVSYLNPYQKKDKLFFFEEDVLKLMQFENVQYTEIPVDHFYESGKLLEKETVDTSHNEDKAIAPITVPVDSISRDEYILLCILSTIVREALNEAHSRFTGINQLYHYPYNKYPTLKGISESSVRAKIKKAHKVFEIKNQSFSETVINTRTENTLHNMIAILLESIIGGLQANFENETEFVAHLFTQHIFDQSFAFNQKEIVQIMLDIMNDFKFITEMDEAVSNSAQ